MTTLISWLGVDSRGPTSVYVASDSRYSWKNKYTWDVGQKLYYSEKHPEIFGLCGDVAFSSGILDSLRRKIDLENILKSATSFASKLEIVGSYIKEVFGPHPAKAEFTALYLSRMGEGMSCSFHIASIKWSNNKGFETVDLTSEMPEKSDLIKEEGTGGVSVKNWLYRWERSDAVGTSRSIFSAFCDSLVSQDDPESGGSPQLIGMYRVGPPRVFGIVWGGELYLSGTKLSEHASEDLGLEWRNSMFERCDPLTKRPLAGAQKQPRPKNV